jgi:glycosyltransferase involved in cell wall biosynthesis
VYAGLWKAKGKYDVILVTSPPLFVGLTAYFLSRVKRVPYVFEVRDLWPESAIETGVLKNKVLIRLSYALESFLYRNAIGINVLTPAFKEKLIRVKHVDPEKIIFIPNAADFALSDEVLATCDRDTFRREHGLEGKKVILYIGAHGVANHLSQVLETAALIKTEMPEVLFLFIGEGMEKPMLKGMASELNLTNVRFLDGVPKNEVFKYIIASDFGASVLKKTDTFKTIYSNKTFDYMACKKPVFLLIDGISRSLIEEAGCGIYVEPENPKEFADKIRYLLSKEENELQLMGDNGYAYVKKHFDREVLANQYLLYLLTVSGKAHGRLNS